MTEQQSTGVKYPEATVELTGSDGNAFNIIGRVQHALLVDVGRAEAQAWIAEAYACESYDDLLALCMRTLNVL